MGSLMLYDLANEFGSVTAVGDDATCQDLSEWLRGHAPSFLGWRVTACAYHLKASKAFVSMPKDRITVPTR
jgi:hypothetical protein